MIGPSNGPRCLAKRGTGIYFDMNRPIYFTSAPKIHIALSNTNLRSRSIFTSEYCDFDQKMRNNYEYYFYCVILLAKYANSEESTYQPTERYVEKIVCFYNTNDKIMSQIFLTNIMTFSLMKVLCCIHRKVLDIYMLRSNYL